MRFLKQLSASPGHWVFGRSLALVWVGLGVWTGRSLSLEAYPHMAYGSRLWFAYAAMGLAYGWLTEVAWQKRQKNPKNPFGFWAIPGYLIAGVAVIYFVYAAVNDPLLALYLRPD